MRLSSSTLLLCALTATAAFADDAAPTTDASKKVDATAKQVDAVTAAKQVDAAAAQNKDDANLTTADDALDAPVVIPTHPLADTSHSAAERAQLSPDDSDAALDRELGLSPKDGEAAEPDGVGLQLIKTLFMLLVVVGFIYLTLNVGLRKLMGIKSGPLGGKSGVVNVVERIPLEQRRTLFVIKAAGEYLLVGTSEGGMTLISRLDTAEVERIQRERGAAQVQLSPFFQKLLSGQKKSGPPPQA